MICVFINLVGGTLPWPYYDRRILLYLFCFRIAPADRGYLLRLASSSGALVPPSIVAC